MMWKDLAAIVGLHHLGNCSESLLSTQIFMGWFLLPLPSFVPSAFPLCPLWLGLGLFCLAPCLRGAIGFWLWLGYAVSSVVKILKLGYPRILRCPLPNRWFRERTDRN